MIWSLMVAMSGMQRLNVGSNCVLNTKLGVERPFISLVDHCNSACSFSHFLHIHFLTFCIFIFSFFACSFSHFLHVNFPPFWHFITLSRYMGMGVSGGGYGARHGPSLMPGGSVDCYNDVRKFLTKIAAQVDDGPCVAHIGPGGSGNYVKMIHNGIEYGDMQLIAEV